MVNLGCDADVCVALVSNLRMLSFLVFLAFIVICWSAIKGSIEVYTQHTQHTRNIRKYEIPTELYV